MSRACRNDDLFRSLCDRYGWGYDGTVLSLFMSSHWAHKAKAREVCAHCPILEECQEWASKQTLPVFGIVGGWDSDERERMFGPFDATEVDDGR